MDRNSLVRVLLIGGILLAAWLYFGKKSNDHAQQVPAETYVNAPGFAPDVVDAEPGKAAPLAPSEPQVCKIHGDRFEAEASARGAGLTHFYLTDARYAQSDSKDMSTTPDVERWRNLRTLFRTPGAAPSPDDQVKYDRFEWTIDPTFSDGCRFVYEDAGARIVKTMTPGHRPFELDVETTVTNRSDAPKKHATSIEAFAYRTNEQVKGKLGRVSPFLTNLECARDDDVKRLAKDASEFKGGWFSEPLDDRYAAIANYYFAQAIVPLEAGPGGSGDKPSCEVLAEQWYSEGQKADDDQAGASVRAGYWRRAW
jgi:YidC/Oxa1 family membrane protein insertase